MRHDREAPLKSSMIGRYGGGAWVDYIVRGVIIGMSNRAPTPSVDIVPTRLGETYGGRYFPSKNAILVYDNPDPDLTRATLIHELAHWKTYWTECGSSSGRSSCGYRGDHDAAFYRVLGPLNRAFGVTKELVAIVERGYSFPRNLGV